MMFQAVRTAAMLLVIAGSLPAQSLSLLQSGGEGPQPLGTQGVAADSTGVYTVHVTGSRFVLRKLDPLGNELWTSQSGEAHWLTASITVAGGSIYLSAVVDGIAPGQTGANGFNAYVARFDGAGNQVWMRQFGTPGDVETGGIAADTSGVYVTSATWSFAQQNYRASLGKFSPDGNLLWTRDLTGLAFWWMPLATDGTNLYLAAATGQDGKAWFNGQPGFAFLRKYSRDGEEHWTRRFAAQPGGVSGLAADDSGVYTVLEAAPAFVNDSSVRKYDGSGREIWTSLLGELANANSPFRAVAVDGKGLYVSGSARTSLPGQCYSGSGDAVVRTYETNSGGELWTREFGTYRSDSVAGLAANATGVFVRAGLSLMKLADDRPGAATPRIRNECVVNAASNIGGGVVPGELVTVTVTGRVDRLLFNGVAAPILAASDELLTAFVPLELAARMSVDVQVEGQGIASEKVTLPVLADRLGVFSADRSGSGQAAIVNEDGSLNSVSRPAQPGSVISLYATGGAATAIAVAISDEMVPPYDIDDWRETYRHNAQILYAEAVGGVIQVNLQVPAGVPLGGAVPLHIMAGGRPIEQSLTIAIGR